MIEHTRQKKIQPSIQVRDVNYFFGQGDTRKQILFDINLNCMPGELIIMTGPSGSGKTTLLTLIGALRTLQDGSLVVMGSEYQGVNSKKLVDMRRRIGFIFQMHNLFDSLTAYQNVKMAAQLVGYSRKEQHDKIIQILTKLGLGERIYYKPKALSGGQRQRVAIARALINRPKVILADEPTAALDKASSSDVIDLMKKLIREEGCTILMVTHDSRILNSADRIINMIDGHIASDVNTQRSIAICEILMKSDIFAKTPPAVLTEIAENIKNEEYPHDTPIFHKGDEGDKFYIVVNGTVEVVINPNDSSKNVFLKPGDTFGEMSLLSGEARNATCIAKEDCELLSLDKQKFQEALRNSENMKDQLLKVFAQRQA